MPLDSHGHLVGPQDPGAQALQCLRNLERLLAVHEFQVKDIRQLVVYVIGDQASLSAAWSAVAGWLVAKFRQLPCWVSPDWVTRDNL